MQVSVDPTRCQGHTLCAMSAPEVFLLSDDDGHASVAPDVLRDGVPAASRGEVEEAVRGCPEGAITITP